MFGSSEEIHVEHLQNNALNIVETICSVVAQPIEQLLRFRYGSRYYAVPVTAGAAALMLFLPVLGAVFTSVMQMIPFVHVPRPVGMFDLGSLAKLYFIVAAVHGYRIWKRMLHMEREIHSEYEGPALPFFKIIPKGDSFWFTRIVLEPAFVFLLAIVLQDFFIVQSSLALYLELTALCLLLKSFCAWFRAWEYLRKILDMKNAAPAISKLVDGNATEEDLAPLHLCTFSGQKIAPEILQATARQIAHAYSPENSTF